MGSWLFNCRQRNQHAHLHQHSRPGLQKQSPFPAVSHRLLHRPPAGERPVHSCILRRRSRDGLRFHWQTLRHAATPVHVVRVHRHACVGFWSAAVCNSHPGASHHRSRLRIVHSADRCLHAYLHLPRRLESGGGDGCRTDVHLSGRRSRFDDFDPASPSEWMGRCGALCHTGWSG